MYVTANRIGWAITMFRDDDPPYDPNAPKTPGQKIFEKTCADCHGANRMGIGMYPPLRGLRHRMDEDGDHQTNSRGQERHAGQPAVERRTTQGAGGFSALAGPPRRRRGGAEASVRVIASPGYPRFYDQEGYPANKPPWGTLNCIDLNTGKLVWKKPLGEYPELAARGIDKHRHGKLRRRHCHGGRIAVLSPARATTKFARSTKQRARNCGPPSCPGPEAPRRRHIKSTAANMSSSRPPACCIWEPSGATPGWRSRCRMIRVNFSGRAPKE